MASRHIAVGAACLIACVYGAGCRTSRPADCCSDRPSDLPTLAERIGAEKIVAVARTTSRKVIYEDRGLNFARRDIPTTTPWRASAQQVARFPEQLSRYFNALAGGATYEGKPMAAAHIHMAITGDEFDRFVRHIADACDEEGVPADLRDALIGRVREHKSEFVAVP